MDIDLLAKMVKEVILDNDTVTLPGVGSFVAELVPSTFSDKGYTIHPPYRRLSFSPRQGTDSLLADLYARSNGVDRETAVRILTEFLVELKEVLKVRKTIMFPGLGRLRATRENHFFFVADEDLDIWPGGFGLAPLSLKTHVETPEEVADAVASLAEVMEEPGETPVEEPVEVLAGPVEEPMEEPVEEPAAVPEETPEDTVEEAPAREDEREDGPAVPGEIPESVVGTPESAGKAPGRRKAVRTVLWVLLGVVAVAVIAWAVLGRVAPDVVDRILYSAEELEILHY